MTALLINVVLYSFSFSICLPKCAIPESTFLCSLSIKVTIAGRTYPLTIDRSEEEAIRKAADAINKNVKDLQSNYAVRDMQDLLAMTSLQFSTDLLKQNKSVEQEQTEKEVAQLDQEIKSFLNQ